MPSYLLIDKDTIKLEHSALQEAKSYNPADVFWVKRNPDKTEITVDVIDKFINDANLASVSDKKLFIIFEAELMNSACQNKILKTIEDADDNTTILFLCANDNTILQTIRSRCQIKYIPPISDDEIKLQFPLFPIDYSDGTLTLAKLYCENKDAKTIYDYAEKLVNCTALDTTIKYTPLLLKPENISLAFPALHYALKNAQISANKKVDLYGILASINRNIAANCNPTNTFDLFLLKLFA